MSECKCAARYLREVSSEVERWLFAASEMTAQAPDKDGFSPAPVWGLPAMFATDCQPLCEAAAELLRFRVHHEIRVMHRPSGQVCPVLQYIQSHAPMRA